jgi:Glycosyl transferases group 1/Glycosyltransferase Family 4
MSAAATGAAVPTPALDRDAVRRLPARPMLVTFGSVQEPDGGLQVRARVLAESLAALGIAPAIVSTRERNPRGPLPKWARSLHVPSQKPRKGFSIEFARLIRDVAATSDVVIVENAMFMPALTFSRIALPMVWDTNECQGLHYSRLPSTLDNRAKQLVWNGLERWAARRCRLAVSIGEPEAREWRGRYPSLRGKLMTVDHVPFARDVVTAGTRADVERLVGSKLTGPVLVFVGTLAAKHNQVAAQWIVDVLAPSLPQSVTVLLCGPRSEQLHGTGVGARVLGLGMVDDIDAVVASADLCLAPLASGAGVKTKVLHYLMLGRRVVGTPLAFEGIEGAPGVFAAPLADLPDLVTRLAGVTETAAVTEERVAAQSAWMTQHHARGQAVDQWREALECLNLN